MEGKDGSGGAGEDGGGGGRQEGVRYLLVVRTKTRVMMRMKTSRNAASPAMMPISSVSFVGFATSPGPWYRAGVRAQPWPAEFPQPHMGLVASRSPLPGPTHDDGQAQVHQLSQDQRVGLYEPAKESGGVSGWASLGTWQCPCVATAPARTRSAG